MKFPPVLRFAIFGLQFIFYRNHLNIKFSIYHTIAKIERQEKKLKKQEIYLDTDTYGIN